MKGAAMYRYRCVQCRTTSPPVLTQAALAQERQSHRALAHGGHVPDGEQIVTPPRFSFFDLPREQQVFGTLIVLVIVIGILVRAL
ncbi:hypothetical protein PH213_20480 [Streptomyces sp. SRF1]|uniref:hypothetical protein n=1 Tax=Streptomyces sp. SRF1 TaxID=1549642 RepID=UPI0025B0A622|nr:hypothetical protein [Streptomyces sp. SRF1]MDN3056884.1 hypothetical protein [Streptomyces sp. SRF1]